jgi:hypothetical protein
LKLPIKKGWLFHPKVVVETVVQMGPIKGSLKKEVVMLLSPLFFAPDFSIGPP